MVVLFGGHYFDAVLIAVDLELLPDGKELTDAWGEGGPLHHFPEMFLHFLVFLCQFGVIVCFLVQSPRPTEVPSQLLFVVELILVDSQNILPLFFYGLFPIFTRLVLHSHLFEGFLDILLLFFLLVLLVLGLLLLLFLFLLLLFLILPLTLALNQSLKSIFSRLHHLFLFGGVVSLEPFEHVSPNWPLLLFFFLFLLLDRLMGFLV